MIAQITRVNCFFVCGLILMLFAIAAPVFVKVNAGYDPGILAIAGRKYDPQMLSFAGISFQGIGWAGLVGRIGFFGIDRPFFEDLFYFRFCHLTAPHPTNGMLGIFQAGMAVNDFSTHRCRLAGSMGYHGAAARSGRRRAVLPPFLLPAGEQ